MLEYSSHQYWGALKIIIINYIYNSRKSSKPSLISNPISFPFLVHFEWYKTLWVCQLRTTKLLCTLKVVEQ
jgi:hypothetical protein